MAKSPPMMTRATTSGAASEPTSGAASEPESVAQVSVEEFLPELTVMRMKQNCNVLFKDLYRTRRFGQNTNKKAVS